MRSIFLILFCAINLFAQESAVDELNCSPSAESGEFKCTGGAQDDARKKAKDKADEVLPIPRSMQVLAWNFSTIGISRVDYDRLVAILSDADVAILQEVEFNATGESSLTVIAKLLSERLKERVCKGWFKSATGDRARHAFIWRNDVVSFVEKSGEIKEDCLEAPTVMRLEGNKLDPHEVYSATFFYKPKKQIFTLASLHWDKKPGKGVDKEVSKVFGKLSSQPWPLILSGDFKLRGSDQAFRGLGDLKFKAALPKVASSNMWIRNISVIRSGVVDFKERFPELDDKARSKIASAPPIGVEISFSAQEAETIKIQMAKKQPARDKASVKPAKKAKKEKPPKPLKPLDLNDDLEGEASLTEKK